MRIIGFNGPPRSGKDTLAGAIQDIHEDDYRFGDNIEYINGAPYDWGVPGHIIPEALIMPCRLAAFALMGLGKYDRDIYESQKDQINPLFGISLRQFMISLMEDWLKPRFGKGAAGQTLAAKYSTGLLATELRFNENLMLVTDIGFQEEVDILSELVGSENFLIVQLRRHKCTFEGDSRSWCYHPNLLRLLNGMRDDPLDLAKQIMSHAHTALGWEF